MGRDTWVIRNAVLCTPNGRVEGDCAVDGQGRIVELGRVTGAYSSTYDAQGRWLWPGVIDAHVHFRTPGSTHKEDWHSASRAAAAGGVTLALDMPNTSPSVTCLKTLADKRALVRQSGSLINLGFFFGATAHNVDVANRAENIAALKIFMASSTGDLLVDQEADLHRIFERFHGRISTHAESESRILARTAEYLTTSGPGPMVHSIVRDPEAARLGVELACALANRYGRRLHVLHMSTAAELGALQVGQRAMDSGESKQGTRITGEACPHHLFGDVSMYADWQNFVKVNPPLREPEDKQATWAGLNDGTLSLVATDHAPHLPEEKRAEYNQAPSGVPGIQTMLPLMLDAAHRGMCSYDQVLLWLCHNPAKLYGIQQRGTLAVGNWADLTLIDPQLVRVHSDQEQQSKAGWTPWRGRKTTGWPVTTWVNGVLVFEREQEAMRFPTLQGGSGVRDTQQAYPGVEAMFAP